MISVETGEHLRGTVSLIKKEIRTAKKASGWKVCTLNASKL